MTPFGSIAIDIPSARSRVVDVQARIEAALADLDEAGRAEAELQRQQAGDAAESSTEPAARVAMTVADRMRRRLREAERAMQRLDAGTYGWSVESGVPIPPDRLAADPLAERTVAEQAAVERRIRSAARRD